LTEFAGHFYDGRSTARRNVKARAQAGRLAVFDEATSQPLAEFDLADVRVDAPLGNMRRILRLPGGGQLQTGDHDAVRALFPSQQRFETWVHGLERRWRYSLAALAIIALVSTWAVIFGVPLAARVVAERVPAEVEMDLGSKTLQSLDSTFCDATALSRAQQESVSRAFGKVTSGVAGSHGYTLEMRNCRVIGANAFALPGGIIVVTDEMARLADNEAELSAVLAHEAGHVAHQHGLRMALQAAGVAVLVTALASDATSISMLAVALPTLLLQTRYSRAFEDEADTFAFARLKAIGLSPRYFAQVMEKLETSHRREAGSVANRQAGSDRPLDYLSSHPVTERRIERALAESTP
jgi:predicted Zn-dependent protease